MPDPSIAGSIWALVAGSSRSVSAALGAYGFDAWLGTAGGAKTLAQDAIFLPSP